MAWQPKLSEHILCKRIPTPPYGEFKDRHIVGYDEYVRTGGYVGLRKALTMKPADVTNEVKTSMLRGRGGAGFPTGLKWTFLPPIPEGKKPGDEGAERYLAINADESEPGTFKDRLLMDFDPHAVLEGIAICCYACGLNKAYIFIRGEYHHQAKVLEDALKEAYENGIFGEKGLINSGENSSGMPFQVDCYVHRGAGAYICGEETALLEALEGKRGWPRIKPPFPAIKGLFGKPTIINNVETLAHLPTIIENGAQWFMDQGLESTIGGPPSFGTKLMGMSGHVERPGVYEFELGIPLRTFVEDYCGGMFDEDTDMVAVARNVARFFKHESCGQCTPCREGSGWLYQLMCRIEEGDARTKDLDLALEIGTSMGSMPGTTICGLADGNNWSLRTIMNKFRSEFEARVRPSHVPVTVSIGATAQS